MAEASSPVSLLPWIWTIEALASDKEVETSFIYDLIEMAPRLPNDLGKNMREMVSLRCLEGLYGPSNGSGKEVSILVDSNVRFDPSESCENVLQFILGKAPLNVKMAQSELVKLDVHSFISHKRASMPKCTLQKLKDDILGGTHQSAVSLKGMSGLSSTNECPTIPFDSDDHITLAQRLHESRTCAQNNRAIGNLASQNPENGNKQLEKVSSKVDSSLCNRDRFEMATEKVAGDISKSQYDFKAKKRKHYDSSITSEDGPCKILTVNETENRGMSLVEPQTSNGVPVKGIHHELHRSGSTFKRGFQLGTPKNASNDDSQMKFITDEYKGGTGDCRQAEKLSDADRHDTGRIDVFMMKNQCLSSQFTSHDSSALADWTEQSLCVKCHEGGQLLVCSAYDCSLMIHENCLGSSAKFDNQGNFCCPFCTYSVAISEYLEAKKKASLARNRLAAFIGPAFEPHSSGLTHRLHAKEYNPRQNQNEDTVEVVQNEQLRETEGNQIDSARDRVNKADSNYVQQCTYDKQQSESLASHVKVNLPCGKEANVNSPTGHVSSNEQEGEDMMAQGCPDARGTEGEKGQVLTDHICDNGKLPRDNREDVHVNRRCIERRLKQEKKFDNENDKLITSILFNKRRRKKINYTYPAIPELRRLRRPFTAEEEEMLKVGVGRFANANEKNIPWKDIMEFGANVFVKGRTTTDLKDKWRNMCRGSP